MLTVLWNATLILGAVFLYSFLAAVVAAIVFLVFAAIVGR